jgi:hypothetical protein
MHECLILVVPTTIELIGFVVVMVGLQDTVTPNSHPVVFQSAWPGHLVGSTQGYALLLA